MDVAITAAAAIAAACYLVKGRDRSATLTPPYLR